VYSRRDLLTGQIRWAFILSLSARSIKTDCGSVPSKPSTERPSSTSNRSILPIPKRLLDAHHFANRTVAGSTKVVSRLPALPPIAAWAASTSKNRNRELPCLLM